MLSHLLTSRKDLENLGTLMLPFLFGNMRGSCTFSIQLIPGVHHGSDTNLKIFGILGTIALIDDKTLFFGKTSENL